MTSSRGASRLDDYSLDLPSLASFAHHLAALRETEYLVTYSFDAIPAFMRHVGREVDLLAMARLAREPNTPVEALMFLAGVCPREFCANPILPLLLLERPSLPADFDPASLGRLLSYEGVPGDLLSAIAQLSHPAGAIAARLHVGFAGPAMVDRDAAVSSLHTIPEDDLLAVLLALGAVPTWLHPRIAASSNPRIIAALAYATGSTPALMLPSASPPPPAAAAADSGVLKEMLASDSPRTRAAAAADPGMSAALLAWAKQEEDWSDCDHLVYQAIAGNPNTPPQILVALAQDGSAINTGTRRAVALNPNAPAEALSLLADEAYAPDIRLVLAAHPNLSAEHRAQMLANSLTNAFRLPDPFYRAVVLSHPTATAEQLVAQSYSPYWIERLAVAHNLQTPLATQMALTQDGIGVVRAAARASVAQIDAPAP